MKTIKHNYFYDVGLGNQSEREDYQKLVEQLKISHAGKLFNVYPNGRESIGNNAAFETVELDPICLFNNQWNEAGKNGRRLFDWYEEIYPNKYIKAGYWLEITPEMQEIRDNTLTCGYCGRYAKVNEPHKWYCEHCLGSEYLKEKDLKLVKLFVVSQDHRDRNYNLSESELAELVPVWKEAQGLGQIQREVMQLAKNRQRIAELVPTAQKKGAELLDNARIETEALTWLMDHEINIIDNVIFYSHTKKFNFGWRNTLNEEERIKLVAQLKGFPFDYEINHKI